MFILRDVKQRGKRDKASLASLTSWKEISKENNHCIEVLLAESVW